jgi:hypothetical protein
VSAQTPGCAIPGTDNASLDIQTIRLWPGTAPEAKGATCNDIPGLTLCEQAANLQPGHSAIWL